MNDNAKNADAAKPAQAAPRPEQIPSAPAAPGKRKRILLALAGVFVVIAAGYGAYWGLAGRYVESTDDAYVSGNVVQITPQIAGTVVAIRADDTDFVRAGEPLVELDRADAKVALDQAEAQLDQAEAQLAQTVRETRGLYSSAAQTGALVNVRETELARAKEDLNRRLALQASGAVSGEEIEHARTTLRAAQANLLAAQQQLATSRALTEGTDPESHPNVQRAAARVREAYLAYERANLPAPVSGYVAKRSVQVGQRIQPGAPLMSVVPLDALWVDANFKEVQLRNMRVGQPVTLVADVYGGKVEYQGRVAGFGAGTGSVFSLLPPQNATGNWIKVVQRVPVRIALDAASVKQHPLRVGLSMQVEVDTHDRSGPVLTESVRIAPAYRTAVYDDAARRADARVAQIIAANGGKRGETDPRVANKKSSENAVAKDGAGRQVARPKGGEAVAMTARRP